MKIRAVFFLFLLGWGIGLSAYPLLESTEGRYASVSAAMVDSGDWVEPTFNGAPLFSKPPLAYWGGAAALSVFPNSVASLRFMSSLALLFCAWCAGRFALAAGLSRHASTWAAVMAGLSPLAVAQGHMNTGDIYLWCGISCVYLAWLRPERSAIWRVLLTGVGWTLGFLAKGHMVLFWTLLPPLAAFAVLRRRSPTWRGSLGSPYAWLLFVALTAPWFIIVVRRHPELLGYWFQDETLDRVASTAHGRAAPWWYFLPQLPLLLLPWLPELLRGLRRGHGSQSHRRIWALWILLPLVVFSVSGSKRPNYLLPMVTPIVLLAASGIDGVRAFGREVRTAIWVLVVLAFPFVMGAFDLAPPTRELARVAAEQESPLVCVGVEPSALYFYRREAVPVYDRDRRNPFAPTRSPEEERLELADWAGRDAFFFLRPRDIGRLEALVGRHEPSVTVLRGRALARFVGVPAADAVGGP